MILVKIFEQITHFFGAKEQMNDLLRKSSDSLICSFILSDLSKSLTVTHLSWVPWVIRSQSVICPERSERSLTVAHLIWAIWVNERIPNPKDYRLKPETFLYDMYIKCFAIYII